MASKFRINTSSFAIVSAAFLFILSLVLFSINPSLAFANDSRFHQISTKSANTGNRIIASTNLAAISDLTSHYGNSMVQKVQLQFIPDSPAYKFNKTIAFIQPTFTYAAYQKGSFYDFYQKYQPITAVANKTITTDLDMLKNKPIPHGPFQYFNDPKDHQSIPYINYFKVLQDHVKRVDPFVTNLTDVDVHKGKIFQANGSNAYDVLFLFHNEYVTASEYNNLRQFVSNGGTIVFTDANELFAEVSYNKTNDSITLVKGHYWKYADGIGATRSISERWLNENKEWHGSNFFDVPSKYTVYFRNNPFNYTHTEEQHVTNPRAKILINYDTSYSSNKYPNATIATYYMDYMKGRVINLGIWGHTLVDNKAFLNYFDNTIIPLALGSHIPMKKNLEFQNYNHFGYAKLEGDDKKNLKKTQFYGCEKHDESFNCNPFPNELKSYAIAGNESQIYPVTRNDSTYVDGILNKALEMHDSNREYVEFANRPNYNSKQFSISFWIKETLDSTSPNGHVISHISQNDSSGWFFDVITKKNNGTAINQFVRFVISSNSGNLIASNYMPVSDTVFTNIVGTFDGSTIRVYRNGHLFQQKGFEGTYAEDPRLPLHIGSAAYCTSCEWWSGFIDEIRLYNRTLSQDEVNKSFLNPSNIVLDGLTGYWKLDGNLNDDSGTKNNGKMFTPIASMAFAPDGRLFFSEKDTGRIMTMKNDRVLAKPFAIIPDVYINWEQGLLGLAVDPNFKQNHYLYLYYTATKNNQPVNRVVRFTDINNSATNRVVLVDNIPASQGYHAGGALAIGPDDKLYITVGDATEHELAQSPSTVIGKVLRINKDGTIPPDNPFPGSPIYTLGHRNMYGIAFAKQNKIGIITENGADLYDEINLIQKGGNYGFPTFQPENVDPELSNSSYSIKPLRSYLQTIAPTQALYYMGNKFPYFKGNFLFGTFEGNIYAIHINNESKQITSEDHIRLHHYPFEPVIGIAQSPDGNIYYGSYHINKLKALNLHNRIQDLFPIEVNSSSDISVDKLLIPREGLIIDTSRNIAKDIFSSSTSFINIKIPTSLLGGAITVTANNTNAKTSSVNFNILNSTSANYKIIHIPFSDKIKTNLRLLIASTTQKIIPKVPNIVMPENLYDNFENEMYAIHEGQVSPNELWFNAYAGEGTSEIRQESNGNQIFFMEPQIASLANESNPALVSTTKNFSDFEMSVDVKTEEQLRQNSQPPPWEVAGVFFRYTNNFNNYGLLLKPTGIELAKRECNNNDCSSMPQIVYLYTNNKPKFNIGSLSHLYIKAVGNQITVGVNGSKVFDYIDKNMSEQLRDGTIGLYADDATAGFDNVYIKSLK
jgi:glucose/arabinose dehydrogenase